MASEYTVGKVTVKVYPDTKTFGRELDNYLRRKERDTELKVNLEPREEGFAMEVRREVRKAERRAGKIEIPVDLDYDHLTRQLKRVNDRLTEMSRVKLTYDNDKKGLEKARKDLENLRDASRLQLKVIEDREGLTEARNRIANILRERQAVTIDLQTDDESLRKAMGDLDRRLEKLTPAATIDLEVEVDQAGLKRNLRKVESALREMDHPKVKLEYDRESLLAEQRRLRDEIASKPIEIEYHTDEDGYREALREINKRIRDQERKVTLEVGNDLVALRRARDQLQDIVDDYDEKEIDFQARVDSWLARAELARVSRTRLVTLVVTVQKGSLMRAEAMLRALSGFRFLERGLRRIWDSFKNIDKNIVIIGAIAQAVAGLLAWLQAATSSTFSLSRGLAQIFGLGLLMPGILAGFAAGIGASVAVLKDMNDVIPELAGMFRLLQDSMSFEFWRTFEEPFRRMVDRLFPEFQAGMQTTTRALGVYWSELADAARRQLGGRMMPMFENLAESILISSQNADVFMSIIETLGRRGSDVLPRLARWWNDVTTNFDNWLTATEKSGRLDEIIETAIQNARDLGWVLYHTGGALAGLARAAEKAGGSTLDSLARKMERVHRAVDRPLFQAGLVRALQAAHEAMDMISTRSGPRVTDFFKNLSWLMERGFRDVGSAIGGLIGGLAETFSTSLFSHGLLDFLRGLREMVDSLGRAWTPLGDGLGEFGRVLGTIARQFGPLLAEMLVQLSSAMQALGPYIRDWITSLSDRLLPIVERLAPMAITLAEAFARILDPLIKLPGVVELAVTAFLGFKLFRGFLKPMDELITKTLGMQVGIGNMGAAAKVAAGKISAWWTALGGVGKAGVIGVLALAVGALVVALTDLGKIDASKVVALDFERLSFDMDRAAESFTTNGAQIRDSWQRTIENFDQRVASSQMENFFDGISTRGVKNISGLESAMRNLGIEMGYLEETARSVQWGMTDAADMGFGRPTQDQVDRSAEAFANVNTKITQLVNDGKLEEASFWMGAIEAEARNVGLGADFIQQVMPGASQAIREAGRESADAQRQMDLMGDASQFLYSSFDNLRWGTPALVAAIQEGAAGFFDIAGAISQTGDAMAELDRAASALDYAKTLEEQVSAQRQWADDMALLAKRGVDSVVVDELARLGPEAAPMVRAMADELENGTREGVNRIEQAIKDGMAGPIGATEGEFAKLVQAASDGLNELPAEVQQTLAEMDPEDLINMTPFGLAAILGLAEGFSQGSPALEAAVALEAENMKRRMQGALEIHSPSRVFHRYGAFTMLGFIEGLTSMGPTVLNTLSTLATGIINLFAPASTWLVESGHGLVGGLVNGIRNRFGDANVTSKGLGDTIRKPFDPAASWLGGRGRDFVSGLVGGINRSKAGAGTASTGVTKAVRTPFDPAGTWLPGRGTEAVRGLAKGLSGALHMVRTAVTAIRLSLVNAFSSAGRWLSAAGGRSIAGLANGIRGGLYLIRSASAGARGAVVGAFGGAGGWLVGAGRRIIAGLASGISSRVGAIRAQLNSLTKAIPSWKGPASTDSRLLFNAGQLIIGGLIDGLESQYKGVYTSLKGLSRGIGGVQIGGPNVGMPYAPQGALRGAQAHLASREGMALGGGDHIEFHGNVGMDPEDVAAAIEWRKRRQAMRMGMGVIARGV